MTSQAASSDLIVGIELHDSYKTRIDMAGLLFSNNLQNKTTKVLPFFINTAYKPKSKLEFLKESVKKLLYTL